MLKTIEQILIDMGAIKSEQLKKAQKEAQDAGIPLVRYLFDQKIVAADALAKAYAQQVHVPYVEKITEKMADPVLLVKIPLHFLRANAVMPILTDDTITILTADPTQFQPIDELNMLLGGDAQYAIATRAVIMEAVNRYYPLEEPKRMIEELAEERPEDAFELGDIEEKDILGMAQEAPIIKLVNHILYQAVKRDASDIHIEPYEKEVRVRYRIDGVLYLAFTPPKRVQGAIASRLKIMANLNIAEKRQPQDGRIDIKVADRAIDIRVSVLPVAFGERIVMRLLDKTRNIGRLKDLGFSDHDLKIVMDSIVRPNGIIMVSGPTGSGKTSTLYSVLSELNKPEVNIVTVENPIEYQMSGVGQVQVNEKIGLTFAAALRSILRQDPDIIMIGETRDQETAQIAVQASLTGHLVLTTIHTNNAPATITRLIDMGVEPFLISSSIVSIIAQRLIRKLCSCKQPYTPSEDQILSIGLSKEEAAKITFYKAVGCPECVQTGFKGRMAIFEIMPMSNAIAKLTIEQADAREIRAMARQEGMTLLIEDGVRRIKEGITTIGEVLAVAVAGVAEEEELA